jgi:acyl-CoA reductase-like NAD-dependent aldehyde dehydrogenase
MPSLRTSIFCLLTAIGAQAKKDAWLAVDNPATSQTVNEVVVAEIEDLDIALNACARAFPFGAKLPQ